jgi:DNA polymerase-3 subunit gamma/tau
VEHTPIHEYQAVLPPDQHLAGLDEVGRLEALKQISLTIEQVMTRQKQAREAAKKLAGFENTSFVQSPEEVDLDYHWKQIIGKIELPSTRMILLQQAKLLQLDSDRALVGVNEQWLTMVQVRLSLLEKAIAITLGSRRVTLIGQHDVHVS